MLRANRRATVGELHFAHAAVFEHRGAFRRRVPDQDFVEFGTPDLIGVRHRLVPGVGKIEHLARVVPRGDELRAGFLHPDGANLILDAQGDGKAAGWRAAAIRRCESADGVSFPAA